MKPSKRKQEIEARKASDPISQLMDREDVDYSSDELPTAPRKEKGLPTIEEMSGLVPDFTNGLSLKEYMDELSDEF